MLDIFDDRGKMLFDAYPNEGDLPSWVENDLKEHQSSSDDQKLASSNFAIEVPLQDGIRPAYPIHNAGMTAVSCLYFDSTYQNLPPGLQKQAASSLDAACNRFGIEPTDTIVELLSDYQEEKTAATPLARAPFQDQALENTPWFPLGTPEQVQKAASNFDTIIRKLSPIARKEFAENLMHKAASFGMASTLPANVQRWGGPMLSPALVMDAIEKRAEYMDPNQLDLLRRAADKIKELHPDKVASMLEELDASLGIDVLWDQRVPDPQAIRMAPAQKVASASIGGHEITQENWKQACDAGVLDMLDPAMQSTLRDNPQMLNEYQGHPVLDHVVGGLQSLGMISDN